MHEIGNTGSRLDIEGSNALRSVNFVTGNAHQINAHFIHIEGNFAERLSAIGVK